MSDRNDNPAQLMAERRYAEAKRAFETQKELAWSDRLRYGLCCLFAGDRARFLEIADRARSAFGDPAGLAKDRPLRRQLLRYAALAAALGITVGCDRATYPYENRHNNDDDGDVEVIEVPVVRYAGPVVSLYAVRPDPVEEPVARYAGPVISLYAVSPDPVEDPEP